jgi:CO/xanthine dehydrogenase FAD-binding subunit
LRGEQSGLDLFRQAKHLAAEETDPTGDIHADADYRREVAGTLTFRALKLASERATKGDA